MKVSFITTFLNEESTIGLLLESLANQTRLPDEIIFVDGGSSDMTVAKVRIQSPIQSGTKFKSPIKFKIIIKRGNRAIGRNEGIKNATGDIILISDAGCTLEKKWVEEIIKPFKDKTVDVVAGYYKGKSKSVFEKCLIPYVLVMPDKADPYNFLPASRSMAFRKSIWKKAGGFPQDFSHNEDYVFAKKLKSEKAKIVFNKEAIVYWSPRKNLKESFVMFFRFALGDAQSHSFRPKVVMLFIRYSIGTMLLVSFFIFKSYFILSTLFMLFFVYVFWSIAKNYHYIEDKKAMYFLPILQITSDIAIIFGTTAGILQAIKFKSFKINVT